MALAKLDVLDSRKYSWYISLIGLAERFRTSTPPNIRLCVHCLKAIFSYDPPPLIEATTHLQLGNILYEHTKNTEQAKMHLEKAVNILHSLISWNVICIIINFNCVAYLNFLYRVTQTRKLIMYKNIYLIYISHFGYQTITQRTYWPFGLNVGFCLQR